MIKLRKVGGATAVMKGTKVSAQGVSYTHAIHVYA